MSQRSRFLIAALTVFATSVATLAASAAAFAAVPEKPETISPPTAVTATAATFHGILNPKATGKVGWFFAYSTEPTCTAAGAGETAHEGEVEVKKLAVEAPVIGLQPNKKYAYCLIATAEEGAATTAGNQVTFTTLAAPPEISESPRTPEGSVTDASATLEEQVNPNNEPTSYTFEYSTKATGETLEGTITKVKGGASLNGYGNQTASVTTGSVLKADETYFFRVTAENATSEKEGIPVEGPVQSFATTPEPITEAPTSITGTGATFQGRLTLGPVATQYHFAYNLGSECANGSATPTVEVKGATPEVRESWEVPSTENPELGYPAAPPLLPNSEYTVCLVLQSAYGEQVGPEVHFQTLSVLPLIERETATGIGVAGIRLEAKINPFLQETTYFFEYATSEAELLEGKGEKIFGEQPLAAELKELPASVEVPAPQPGITYFFRATAENESSAKEGAPAIGEVKSYALPVVTTDEVENVARTTATLSGTVNPEGAETSYRFVYVTRAGYEKALAGDEEEKAYPYAEGQATEVASAGSSSEPQMVAATQITGLRPGKTYDYTLVATSAIGTEVDPPQVFTTLGATPPGVTTEEATNVTQTAATLTGAVTTNGLQTTYAFEIGTEAGNYGPGTGLGTIGGATTQAVSATLNDLEPGSTYYFRLRASNVDGTTYGQPQAFTTAGLPYLLVAPIGRAGIPIPATAFGVEPKPSVSHTRPLTKAQRLHRALAACRKDRKKSKRLQCEKAARKKYEPAAKKRKSKK